MNVWNLIKCPADDLVIKYDEIVDTPDIPSINSFDKNVIDKSSNWLPFTVLLAIICLILLVVITISC